MTVNFSIIVPTYNHAKFLKNAIDSVINQTYANWELIIVDNFSEDDTFEIVSSFNDKRISYYNTNKTISMSHNWEFALEKISEGYVTILGSDDGHIPGTCKIVNDIIKKRTNINFLINRWLKNPSFVQWVRWVA